MSSHEFISFSWELVSLLGTFDTRHSSHSASRIYLNLIINSRMKHDRQRCGKSYIIKSIDWLECFSNQDNHTCIVSDVDVFFFMRTFMNRNESFDSPACYHLDVRRIASKFTWWLIASLEICFETFYLCADLLLPNVLLIVRMFNKMDETCCYWIISIADHNHFYCHSYSC